MSTYVPPANIDIAARATDALSRLPPADYTYRSRLLRELEYIVHGGLAQYVAAVTELVDVARSMGIMVAPGRGSAPSSLILYLLGITQIDPIRHELIVARWFSNPVIEIEVEYQRRRELIDHLWGRYGDDCTAYICSYRRDRTTGEIISREPNAACYAISSQPITELLPTWTADDGRLVIDAVVYEVEERGLGVLSILGMKQLDVVAGALGRMQSTSPQCQFRDILEYDVATLNLFRTADTDDVFLFSSTGMKRILKRVRPESMHDLVVLNAAHRPPHIRNGTLDDLVRTMSLRSERARGISGAYSTGDYIGVDPVDAPLAETFGMLLFQEQFIEIVHKLTGWSRSEAELYRRRAKQDADNRQFQSELVEATRATAEISQERQDHLRSIVSRSRHTYLKAHAVGYVRIAWTMGYLKAHHREEFERGLASAYDSEE